MNISGISSSRLRLGTLREHSLLGLVLFLLIFSAYFAAKERIVPFGTPVERNSYLLTGDSPCYLLATHSVAFDLDFNLYNNSVQKDYLTFTQSRVGGNGYRFFRNRTGKIDPQNIPREWSYMPWDYGLPILLAPAYRIGYAFNKQVRYFCVVFLNILATFLVWVMYRICLWLSGHHWASFWIALTVGLSIPLFPYSYTISHDMIGALCIALVFLLMIYREYSPKLSALAIGILVAFLPWLHVRNLFNCIVLTALFLWETRRKKKLWVWYAVPVFISAVLRIKFNYFIYGVWYPVAAHLQSFNLGNAFREGFLAVWFDRSKGGLLWFCPILLFSFPGMVLALKDRRVKRLAAWMVIVTITNYFVMAMYKEWWGGTCPPLRYALVMVILMTPFVVLLWTKLSSFWARGLMVLAGLWGLWGMSTYILKPGLLYREYNAFLYKVLGDRFFFYLPDLYTRTYEGILSGDQLAAMIWLVVTGGIVSVLTFYGMRSTKTSTS